MGTRGKLRKVFFLESKFQLFFRISLSFYIFVLHSSSRRLMFDFSVFSYVPP